MSKRPKVHVHLSTPPSQRHTQSAPPLPAKGDGHAWRQYSLGLWEDEIHAIRAEAFAAGKKDFVILAGNLNDPKMRELATGYYDEKTVRTLQESATKHKTAPVMILAVKRFLARAFLDECEPGLGGQISARDQDGYFTVLVADGGGFLVTSLRDR